MASFVDVFQENEEDEEDDNEFQSPDDQVFKAILKDDVSFVKQKIDEGFAPLTLDSVGFMSLHFGVLNSKVWLLDLFKDKIENKDIINTINKKDDTICGTPLHVAMDGQVSCDVALRLLQWGADVNGRDIKGATVLIELIGMAWRDFEDNFETEKVENEEDRGSSYFRKLRLLKQFNVDMNLLHEKTKLSPLHTWCQMFFWCTEHCLESDHIPEWCKEFLKCFLQCGIDPYVTDDRHETALVRFCQRHYKPHNIGYIASFSEISRSIVQITDLKNRDIYGRSVLHSAAEFSNVAILREVLQINKDVNMKDKCGLTPLHLITHNITKDEENFVVQILQLLVKAGANVNIQDKHGSTPAHHAVHLRNSVVLMLLIEQEADTSLKDKNGLNVNDLAVVEGDHNILETLGIFYERGAKPIIVGVSDNRYGWFYPRCCHKTYYPENRGVEEPETVKNTEIDQWLIKYPMCSHNASMILQNSLTALDRNERQQCLTHIDGKTMKLELFNVLQKIADRMRNVDPLFDCEVIYGGSVSENTKVGANDEADFVFNLKTFARNIYITEDDVIPGYVHIKPKGEIGGKIQSMLGDVDGFIKRSVLSNKFHAMFAACLRQQNVWEGTNFYCYWGTPNFEGECFNIGQMTILWYGPFKKRQQVKLDIVPAIKINDWQSKHVRSNVKIIDSETARKAGCYLVLKNVEDDLIEYLGIEADVFLSENNLQELEDSLFKISFSQLEHAIVSNLPQKFKDGFKLAKGIQLQCPLLSFDMLDFPKELKYAIKYDAKGFAFHIDQFISSYRIKMALLQILQEEDTFIDVGLSMDTAAWNNSVLGLNMFDYDNNIKFAIEFARRLYRKLQQNVDEHTFGQEYFLPTGYNKWDKEDKACYTNAISAFCKVMISVLENFNIPDEFLLQ